MIKSKRFQTILWFAIAVLGFLAYSEALQINVMAFVGSQNIWASRRFIAFIGFSALSLLLYLFLLLAPGGKRLSHLFRVFRQLPKVLKIILSILLVTLPGILRWFMPLPANFAIGFWMELFLIFVLAELSSALFLNPTDSAWQKLTFLSSLALAAGAAHSILYRFNSVTPYPFTLYWSEGNRFFDYSTLLGSFRYRLDGGEKIKAFISWGMALPWSIPFIVPKISIAFYRFWYQLVWVAPALALGTAAIWPSRKRPGSGWFITAFALWVYLFLDQGPIYAPLVLGALFTVIAVRQKLLPGMLILFIISYYTRSARWTWSYAPGIWAGLLALLNLSDPTLKKRGWPDLTKPVLFGISGYLGGQILPSVIRALNSNAALRLLPNPMASTSRQPLLWERLLPNPTFPPGILGGLAWAALPVVLLLAAVLISKVWPLNWLQKSALALVSGAFLTVGIIASVKIGGGSNLHNLDMYLVTLALLAANAINHLSKNRKSLADFPPILHMLLIAAIIAPLTYTMSGDAARLSLPSEEKVQESLAVVQDKVEQYSQAGEILFIDHRQLLTFNLIRNVPLVDDYEKKYLMDQAMAANASYFNKFYEDLANHRFALIVNEPANIIIRGTEYSFGEENDAYVRWVTKPLLCAYEPVFTSLETSLQLLAPRKTPPSVKMDCPVVFKP